MKPSPAGSQPTSHVAALRAVDIAELVLKVALLPPDYDETKQARSHGSCDCSGYSITALDTHDGKSLPAFGENHYKFSTSEPLLDLAWVMR